MTRPLDAFSEESGSLEYYSEAHGRTISDVLPLKRHVRSSTLQVEGTR